MAQRHYIDFKLYLTKAPDDKGACQVALLPTPEVGETIIPITVPIEDSPDAKSMQLLAAKKGTFGSMVALGKSLANCLLPEGIIRDRFKAAYDFAGTDGGVRLRLIIADYNLKSWPWEYTYFDFIGGSTSNSMLGFLVLNPRISMVRHEPLPHPHPIQGKSSEDITNFRIAFASSLPEKQPKLNLDRDLKVIRDAVKDFDVEGVHLTIDPVLTDATPDDIDQKLPKGTLIFHFAGHGIPESDTSITGPHREGALLLIEDKKTKIEARLHASDLAAILQNAGVRMAFLGACYTGKRPERYPWDGIASALAAREIPAIIAMQYEVYDNSAQAFTRAFYGALASGLSLDEAMSVGRRAMLRETSTNPDLKYEVDVEWGVPVLYSRLPDGALFPERMSRAGSSAKQFRKVVNQQVKDAQAGIITGVKVSVIKGEVSVEQEFGVLGKGREVTGVKANKIDSGAKVRVKQKFNSVKGKSYGIKLKELP